MNALAADATSNRSQAAPHVLALPAQVTLGFEHLRLAEREGMGLLGASYLVELQPGWWAGPALYGAATGQRGGLLNWGAQAKRQWRLRAAWSIAAGLYAGGGGGANAPVGGGLMLRPHLDLMRDFGAWSAGVTASRVRFPGGTIDSSQLGVQVALAHDFSFTEPGHGGRSVEWSGSGGLGTDRMDVAIGRNGAAAGRYAAFGYVGMRLYRQQGAVMAATIEAAGAATGGADGYAEALVGAVALWPLGSDAVRVGVRGAAGLGGGGAVLTGGGPIAKIALAGRLQLNPQASLELDAGRVRSLKGDFDSPYAQLSVGVALVDAAPRSGVAASHSIVRDMEWALCLQNVSRAQRKDGTVRPMSILGLKFRRSLDDRVYLSGQAHSEISGGEGAYSAGLVGLGVTAPLAAVSVWSVGVEAMVGAGGGGGIASQGGALVQPMAWVGRDLGRFSQLKFGAGFVKSVRGDLASPVVDVTWGVRFGVP